MLQKVRKDTGSPGALYAMLVDNAPVLLWASGPGKSRFFFNGAWLRYTGRSLEEEREDGWLEGVHPDDRQRCMDMAMQADAFGVEYRLRKHDGKYGWVSERTVPHYFANGDFAGFVGSCIEIDMPTPTQALAKEERDASRDTERRLHAALAAEKQEHVTAVHALATSTEQLSEAHRDLAALNEELEGKVRARTQALAENELLNRNLNDELAAANEELASINEELRAVNEELLTVNEDLAESEYLTRSIIVNAPFAIAVYSGREMRVVEANQAIVDVWGKGNEVIGKHYAELLPELANQGVFEQLDAVYMTGIPYHARNQRIDLVMEGISKTFYFNYSFTPLRNRLGDIYGVMNTAADVTDVVMAKFEVERVYEQSRLSKDAAGLGIFDFDLVASKLEWDNRCRELFGVALESDVSYERDFVGNLHQEDRQPVLDAVRGAQDRDKTNGDFEIEYRVADKDGQGVRWIKANGKVYFDDAGKPLRFIGTVQDITDRKHDEIRRQEHMDGKARLGAIVETTDDTIISKTLQGIITSWNRAAQRMFGYAPEEAIGQHISLIIPPSRLHEEEAIIGEVVKGNKVDHFETFRVGKDGQEVPVSITVSPLIDDRGVVIGASKIARDISMKLAAEESASRYAERLEIINSIVESISEDLDLNNITQKVIDSITLLTEADFGVFLYDTVGEAGQSEKSYAFSDTANEALLRAGVSNRLAELQAVFSGGVVRVNNAAEEMRHRHVFYSDGNPNDYAELAIGSYLAVPVVSRLGEVIGGLFLAHPAPDRFSVYHEQLVVSIAAQAAIGLDNAKLYAQVKALNDKKDEFIGLASHELKTPLTSVYAYLQILADRPAGERSKLFVEKALRQAKKLTTLVNDLLDVSKIEAGKLQLNLQEFDLRKLTEDTIELIAHTQERSPISFDSSVAATLVYSDSQRVEQVIINLLTNAIKYSPEGSEVRVSLESSGTECRIGVHDLGRGIPAAELPLVFTRFYRVAESGSHVSGLGIGLYLSHEIVTRLGGRLWAESRVGAGSIFWFTIPIGLPQRLRSQSEEAM